MWCSREEDPVEAGLLGHLGGVQDVLPPLTDPLGVGRVLRAHQEAELHPSLSSKVDWRQRGGIYRPSGRITKRLGVRRRHDATSAYLRPRGGGLYAVNH